MRKSSISQVVFSLMLFLMFVIGGFLMISYSGNIYKNIINESEKREAIQIPLAYISEKINKAKNKDYVSIESIDGIDVLIIGNEEYYTCIYNFDGYLKELNINDLNSFKKEAGTSIYKVDKLTMTYLNGLYTFDIKNKETSDTLSLKLR